RFFRAEESGLALFAPGPQQKFLVSNRKGLTAILMQNRHPLFLVLYQFKIPKLTDGFLDFLRRVIVITTAPASAQKFEISYLQHFAASMPQPNVSRHSLIRRKKLVPAHMLHIVLESLRLRHLCLTVRALKTEIEPVCVHTKMCPANVPEFCYVPGSL